MEETPRDAQELFQAQAHIWNHVFNFINSMSLKCAIELGIPDIIHKHGEPMTLDQLVQSLPINKAKAPFVCRVMRILIHSGFFSTSRIATQNDESQEGYMLTSASKLLVKDSPFCQAPFVTAILDPIMIEPYHFLGRWFRGNDDTTCDTCHGKPFFELASLDPKLNHLFNEAMASDARLVSNMIIRDHRDVFEGLHSLVDVGGGNGAMAMAIADAFPSMKCTVLELPHVVDSLEGRSNGLVYVKGDMFESIPPAYAVLLKWILHDWSDEECISILKKCKETIPNKEKGGKVIVIDMLLMNEQKKVDDGCLGLEAFETQLFFDIQMMLFVRGRERTEKEWAKLFIAAGFNEYKIAVALGLRSVIEVYY